uniref:Uncharacterized protein n=1 Tax=Anguilla anguilla TaxID=7936 RepID=A0A0E9PDT9_ANGAN
MVSGEMAGRKKPFQYLKSDYQAHSVKPEKSRKCII